MVKEKNQRKIYFALVLLVGLPIFPISKFQRTYSTGEDLMGYAITLGGAGYLAKKLYNWYQRKQRRALNQKEKDFLIDRVLEGVRGKPNMSRDEILAILDFLDVNRVSRNEFDEALERYFTRHSNNPYPRDLARMLRDIFWNLSDLQATHPTQAIPQIPMSQDLLAQIPDVN